MTPSDDQLHFQLYRRTQRDRDESDSDDSRHRLAQAFDELEDLLVIEANQSRAAASPQAMTSMPVPGQADTVDRILEILDAGLQRPVGRGPGHTNIRPGECARCRTHRTGRPDADLCSGCRAYLLGDTDRDPATGLSTSDWEQ